MKLSEAIRLNGVMKPQGRSKKSMVSPDAPCALGGALQSIGQQPKKWHWYTPDNELLPVPTAIWAAQVVVAQWPFVLKPAECPCGEDHSLGTEPQIVLNVIAMLNDIHEWTRNQIADWVATVEPDEPTGTEEMPQLEHATLNK